MVEQMTDQSTIVDSRECVLLSPPESDMLYGLEAIARYMGMTVGQARPHIESEILPTFRLPGCTTRCASKASLTAAWRDYEMKWRAKHIAVGERR